MEPTINSAIRKGYFQQVRFLIEFGHNVNCRDEERRTPLMNCALVQDLRWGVGLARILIEKRAVMAYRDRRGMNTLHYACIHNRKDLVQVLLRSPDFDINQGDLLGNTSLHYAVTKGNTEITRLLIKAIEKYSLKIDKPNRRGITPLMLAWKSGQEECAHILVEEGNADETLRESVEHKSATDFEEELRSIQEQQKQHLERRSFGGYVQRPKRPVSAVFRSQSSISSAGGRSMRSRPRSAVLLGRRHTGLNDTEQDDPDLMGQVEKEKPSGKLYKSASYNDLRNKPEYIFNITPMECFSNETQYQSPQKHAPLTCVDENQQSPASSWKTELKGMYSTFDFQFTKSFRHPAKPTDNDSQDRESWMGSPHPSDYDSLRDPVTLERLAKKTGKKIAVKNALTLAVDLKNQRKGSGKSMTRKTSSTNSLKSQQTSLDTSSCESVNSSTRNSKKRNMSTNSDIRDDASDVSTSDSKTTKARSRKVSTSSMEDHVTNPDQSTRGTSRGLPIPVVKETAGQDQLGSILE